MGYKRSGRWRCLKCGAQESGVVTAHTDESGVTIRRRKCLQCGHRWYTAQEPEYLVKTEDVCYQLTEKGHSKPVLRFAEGPEE